jgi:molybdopterin/thiamine biosynthesis adenylyltransferase
VSIELSDSERERYARQIEARAGGEKDQLRLRRSRALVIGAGALGSTAAGYLAAAGVGYVGVVDGGQVARDDLSRQLVQLTPDIGSNKAQSVVAKLRFLNPEVQVESYPVELTEANAEALVEGFDVVLDCAADDALTELLAQRCEPLDLPLVTAAPRPDEAFPGPAAGVAGALAADEALGAIALAEAPT